MSDNGYMIWFIATAAMIIAVLTIGTLAAAGLIGDDNSPTRPAPDARASGDRANGRTPADDDAAAAAAADERRLETEPTDGDPDGHGARAYANAGRQR
ncbi:hypothetical protein [Nocardioides sp. URHA0032]|uniref:hypothetical protein n=1 Tax=Nocardioides sp. URHA0032 TaxID=1380388 RepID=UPI00048BB9E4|nr:hypothetical protein [Nocardioides sp. URHA0032]